LQKTQEYWWYAEAFYKRLERKELVQIAGKNRSIWVNSIEVSPHISPLFERSARRKGI